MCAMFEKDCNNVSMAGLSGKEQRALQTGWINACFGGERRLKRLGITITGRPQNIVCQSNLRIQSHRWNREKELIGDTETSHQEILRKS